MCGSSAVLDSTGAVEMYGYACQTASVYCNDDFNRHCPMALSCDADFDYVADVSTILIDAWNNIRPFRPFHTFGGTACG